MRLKLFLLAVVMFIFIIGGAINTGKPQTPEPAASPLVYNEGFTYLRVLIEGQWWIFVFDLDGSFVDAYLDEDD